MRKRPRRACPGMGFTVFLALVMCAGPGRVVEGSGDHSPIYSAGTRAPSSAQKAATSKKSTRAESERRRLAADSSVGSCTQPLVVDLAAAAGNELVTDDFNTCPYSHAFGTSSSSMGPSFVIQLE
ncbi:hypothetical protein DUNSADRAFT_1072, partial [Dunaliella salina]